MRLSVVTTVYYGFLLEIKKKKWFSPGITLASTVCKSRLTDGLDGTLEALISNYKADPTMTDVNGYNAVCSLELCYKTL